MHDNNISLMKQAGWSAELLYQLIANIKDYAIYLNDLEGKIVSWNIGAEKVFGYSTSEAIGQHARIVFTEEDRDNGVPEQEMKTAVAEGCAEDERWHLRRDGSFFFASGVLYPLYDESDKHTGYAKIARDLTERLNLQEEIRELKESVETRVRERIGEFSESNESLRLEIDYRQQSEQLRVALLRKIVRAQEDERKRIARDIHDNIGQQVVA